MTAVESLTSVVCWPLTTNLFAGCDHFSSLCHRHPLNSLVILLWNEQWLHSGMGFIPYCSSYSPFFLLIIFIIIPFLLVNPSVLCSLIVLSLPLCTLMIKIMKPFRHWSILWLICDCDPFIFRTNFCIRDYKDMRNDHVRFTTTSWTSLRRELKSSAIRHCTSVADAHSLKPMHSQYVRQ